MTNTELLVDFDDKKLSISFDEEEITSVNITDNPNYYSTSEKKTFYYHDYSPEHYGVRSFTNTNVYLHEEHNYSTYIFTKNRKICINGKFNAQPGMHIRICYMHFNDKTEECGTSIPELHYFIKLLKPSGYIHNLVYKGAVPNNTKVKAFIAGTNHDGSTAYKTLVPAKLFSNYQRKIFNNILTIFLVWIIFLARKPIDYLLDSIFNIIGPKSYDIFLKIEQFLKSKPLYWYVIILSVITLLCLLKIKKIKHENKIKEERKKREEEIYNESHKEDILREKKFNELCLAKAQYADQLVLSYLNIE